MNVREITLENLDTFSNLMLTSIDNFDQIHMAQKYNIGAALNAIKNVLETHRKNFPASARETNWISYLNSRGM